LYFGGPGIDATADLVLTGEVSDDAYGTATGVGDLNGDGFGDFVVGAYDNDETGNNAGKAYVYFGGSPPDATPEYTMTGEAPGDNYGVVAEALGDINGDGTPEFAVAAYMHDATGENSGRVYIYTLASLVAKMDIKPGSCPNPLNLKPFLNETPKNAKHAKGGVLPVAILGGDNFDVTDIDASTVLLEGVEPLRHDYTDVSTPPSSEEECACTQKGADGFMDMTLKFQTADIVAALGAGPFDETIVLTITGKLYDGTTFEVSDCVKILNEESNAATETATASLRMAVPNPFNPVTRIVYTLPKEELVHLAIYDVMGRRVATLVRGVQGAGDHVAEWNAVGFASGVYYCRIEVGDFTATRKMILLK
jgi:hypothetical protein